MSSLNKARVAILATGDEVTSGQILNSNTQWLAAELESLGFEVVYHLSVQDEMSQITTALEFLSSRSSYIFIMGGLGPTRDDLTRHSVSEFLEKKLLKNETEWQVIQEKLASRAVKVRPGHEQQAFFPEGAEILINSQGTASGFKVSSTETSIYCLPGPPNELKAIFNENLRQNFMSLNLESQILKTWQFVNIPESSLASQIEGLYLEWPYHIGYRASPPIVEFKLWLKPNQLKDYDEIDKKVSSLLKEHLHSRQGQDFVAEFFKKNKNPILIIDDVTEGLFFERCITSLTPQQRSLIIYQTSEYVKNESLNKIYLSYDSTQKTLVLKYQKEKVETDFVFSLQKPPRSNRHKKYCIEVAFKKLSALA